MKRRDFLTCSAAIVASQAFSRPATAAETCKWFAEASVDSIRAGALAVCKRTKNKVACAIAAAMEDAAVENGAKAATEDVCNWVVQKLGDVVTIKVEADKAHEKQFTEVVSSLKESKAVKSLD